MNDTVYIQHRFTISRDGKTLQDAICLPQEEYNKLTLSEIEAQKEERFLNWVNIINNPVEAPEPTKEDLEVQVASIDSQIKELESQKIQMSSKLEAVIASEVLEQPIKKVVVK